MPRSEIPLARLFTIAVRTLLERVHARLRERGYDDVGTSFGYVLLDLRAGPKTAQDIVALMGTSKQAVSKLLDTMEAAGYVERRAHDDDARAKLVRITARGRRLLAVVETIYAELEDEWRREIGAGAVERVREDVLRALLAMHGGVLPAVRPL